MADLNRLVTIASIVTVFAAALWFADRAIAGFVARGAGL